MLKMDYLLTFYSNPQQGPCFSLEEKEEILKRVASLGPLEKTLGCYSLKTKEEIPSPIIDLLSYLGLRIEMAQPVQLLPPNPSLTYSTLPYYDYGDSDSGNSDSAPRLSPNPVPSKSVEVVPDVSDSGNSDADSVVPDFRDVDSADSKNDDDSLNTSF